MIYKLDLCEDGTFSVSPRGFVRVVSADEQWKFLLSCFTFLPQSDSDFAKIQTAEPSTSVPFQSQKKKGGTA